jgi:drug/metabolite transporter (DMT)-like permease
MIRSNGAATALGFAVAFLWGMTFISIKVALSGLSPMTLALSRFIVASALLPLMAFFIKEKLSVRPRDLPVLAAAGLVGVTLYFFFENNGILRLSASESSLIIGAIPVLTILAERFIYGARHGKRVYAGIILSFAGVALIVTRSSGGSSSLPGYLFMGGAALSWVAYTFLTKPLSGKYGLLAVTFWQIFFGMLGCIPFAILENFKADARAISLPPAVWLNVLYLGIFASAIGYWFYVITLERLGASKSSVFINLIPLVSVAAAYILLGERLGPEQLAGGFVAIAGVFLATAAERKPRSKGGTA